MANAAGTQRGRAALLSLSSSIGSVAVTQARYVAGSMGLHRFISPSETGPWN